MFWRTVTWSKDNLVKKKKEVITVIRIGGKNHLKVKSFNFLEEEFCNCLTQRYTGDIKLAIEN